MSTADNKDNNKVPVVCANCGKGEESSDSLKACTACKLVKYCNRDCQIAHRPQHKKACKKRVAELHEELLFKPPPPIEDDCPICFLRMPTLMSGSQYMSCCGKIICNGCIYAPVYDDQGNKVKKTCPFCRNKHPKTEEELVQMTKKLVEIGNTKAISNLGALYYNGADGLPQDYERALELWHRAAELGVAEAYHNIGHAYETGRGVKMDKKKSLYYLELAAMRGSTNARHNLGVYEEKAGNMNSALKHYMIAVRGGYSKSLKNIKLLYSIGHATKEDYTAALQSYQIYLDEIKSDQRDKAAATDDLCKYID